eukprot:87411-Pelagomonas_calceolata.AAC.10
MASPTAAARMPHARCKIKTIDISRAHHIDRAMLNACCTFCAVYNKTHTTLSTSIHVLASPVFFLAVLLI